MKLEDLLRKRLGIGKAAARALVASDRVSVDGSPALGAAMETSRFETILCNGETIQRGAPRLRLMLHKPAGFLSATKDPVHRTVLDLIDPADLPDKATLHLAGRLDRSSTGLVLLSNDGAWSESLTRPGGKVEKTYLVGTDRPIPDEAIARFVEGFWFASEGVKTKPARLELLGERLARVTLVEGRYHQIKRMFHRLDGIRLVSLHRERIGPYRLPDDLLPGQWRHLDTIESVTPQKSGFD